MGLEAVSYYEIANRIATQARGLIASIFTPTGFTWKKARIVLTSTDPDYREKLAHVQEILANLKDDERFFSVDEYGPFAIKMRGGRALVGRETQYTVPQWQESKGWLINFPRIIGCIGIVVIGMLSGVARGGRRVRVRHVGI